MDTTSNNAADTVGYINRSLIHSTNKTREELTREKLTYRSVEDLKYLTENFHKQIGKVSSQLVEMLQERHELREEVEMRKIGMEQLIRTNTFTTDDIQNIICGQNRRHSAPPNLFEQSCFEYVLKLSQTETSNNICEITDFLGNTSIPVVTDKICDNDETCKLIKNNKRLSLRELTFSVKDNMFLNAQLT